MSFWPCPTCETSNTAGVARCEVCGADRPTPAPVRARAAAGASRSAPAPRRPAAVMAAPARPRAAYPTAPAGAGRSVAPVRLERRTSPEPPAWRIDGPALRLQLMQFMARVRGALQRWLRG